MAAPAISSRCPRKRIPWPRHSRRRFLGCLVRASEELRSVGLCRSCCEAACRSETRFGGLKEDVLARDGRRRRVGGAASGIAPRRKSGRNELAWLPTLCAACPATAHRPRALDRHWPPPLVELWREQRPEGFAAPLPFDWEARA